MDNLARLHNIYEWSKVSGQPPHKILELAPEHVAFDMLVIDAGLEYEKDVANKAQREGATLVVVVNK